METLSKFFTNLAPKRGSFKLEILKLISFVSSSIGCFVMILSKPCEASGPYSAACGPNSTSNLEIDSLGGPEITEYTWPDTDSPR